MSKQAIPHPDGFCYCGVSRSQHIGDLPCVRSAPIKVTRLSDLPLFGWAWREDARDVEH